MITACPPVPGGVLLDVGCGDGTLASEARRRLGASEVLGIDILPHNLLSARNRGIRPMLADLESPLPIREGSIDAVLASHVIEHLADTDQFVRELYRVLKPGGYAAVATPNLSAWPNVLFLILGQQPPSTNVSDVAPLGFMSWLWRDSQPLGVDVGHVGSNKHRRVFVRDSLIGLFRFHGFLCERVLATGFPPFAGVLAELVARMLPAYARQLVLLARKQVSAR